MAWHAAQTKCFGAPTNTTHAIDFHGRSPCVCGPSTEPFPHQPIPKPRSVITASHAQISKLVWSAALRQNPGRHSVPTEPQVGAECTGPGVLTEGRSPAGRIMPSSISHQQKTWCECVHNSTDDPHNTSPRRACANQIATHMRHPLLGSPLHQIIGA